MEKTRFERNQNQIIMSKDVIKEYSNGEITVVWQSSKCIHAGVCVKMLPEVYNPKARPWINIDNADTVALKEQVLKCPSGALTYYMNGAKNEVGNISTTKVEVLNGGPLLVHGTLNIVDQNGEISTKERTTAFCRCGHSANKPYCDGAHQKAGFDG